MQVKQNRDDKKKRRRNRSGDGAEDYRLTKLRPVEVVRFFLIWTMLDTVIAFLFFRSMLAFAVLFPAFGLFLKDRRIQLGKQRRKRLREGFLSGMQFFSTALQAGYAPENAFRESLRELSGMYGEEEPIVREFGRIVTGIGVNVTPETLLTDLGERSGVEDIRNFAEVFTAARRTGGDLIAIVRNTVTDIQQKEETALEIETVLAGRQMEQRMMSVIPLFILAYVGLTSPDFLAPLYGNALGAVIMMICLLIYLAAYLWGRKIMEIEV